jgi:hypothetical protein
LLPEGVLGFYPRGKGVGAEGKDKPQGLVCVQSHVLRGQVLKPRGVLRVGF